MKLFYSPISPPCRAVLMVINALKINNVKTVELNILTRNYLTPVLMKINPQHCVPTIEDNGFVIWDSHAIAAYLVNKYSKYDSMYPNHPKLRALVDQRLHFDSGILYPTLYKIIYPILFSNKTGITVHEEIEMKNVYSILNKFLENHSWIAGHQLTIADLCCMASISTLDYIYPINEKYPQLMSFLQNCKDLHYYDKYNQNGLDLLGQVIQEKVLRALAKINL